MKNKYLYNAQLKLNRIKKKYAWTTKKKLK